MISFIWYIKMTSYTDGDFFMLTIRGYVPSKHQRNLISLKGINNF